MVISRGDIVWVDFGPTRGSQPAEKRPAVVMQDDWLLATEIRTVLVVPLTSTTALDAFPGNVALPKEASGLPKDSVAVVSHVGPVGREYVDPFAAGHVPQYLMRLISAGVRLVLGM